MKFQPLSNYFLLMYYMKYFDVVANRRASLYPKVKAIEISRPTNERHFSLWRMNSVSSVSKAFISLNVCIY